ALTAPVLSRRIELNFMRSASTTTNSLALAQRAAQIALDNKAQDVVLLDLRGITDMTDFFVIASGTSDTHVRAVGEHLIEDLKKEGSPAPRRRTREGTLGSPRFRRF